MLATLLTLVLLLPVAAMLHRISAGRRPLALRARLSMLANDRGAAGDDSDDSGEDTDDDDSSDEDDDSDDDSDDDEDDDKPLGPKGEKAYQAEKEKRRAAQAALREFKKLGLTPAQIAERLASTKTDDGEKPDAEKIREQARAEARAEALRERVTDKIEAKARGFADPEDAVAILLRKHDPDDFLDGDKIDVEAIEEALTDLLEKKPHLAVQDGKRFKGSGDGGARKERKAKATSLEAAIASRITGS